MGTAVELAALIAQLLPLGLQVYQKIQENNTNAGLVPVDQLLADALANAAATKNAAQAEIDKLNQ